MSNTTCPTADWTLAEILSLPAYARDAVLASYGMCFTPIGVFGVMRPRSARRAQVAA